jgi:hypothetical protein
MEKEPRIASSGGSSRSAPGGAAGGRPAAPATFVVRLAPDEAGRLQGVVERVRTGEKAPVADIAAISAVIAWMLQRGAAGPEGQRPPVERREDSP